MDDITIAYDLRLSLIDTLDSLDFGGKGLRITTHKIDQLILEKSIQCHKVSFLESISISNLINYVSINRMSNTPLEIRQRFLKEFEWKLFQTIFYAITFEEKAFSKNQIYKVYREKIPKEKKVEDCYSLAIMSLKFDGWLFKLSLEELYFSITENANNYVESLLLNRKTHKKTMRLQLKERLTHIELIESGGKPMKDYYPFYDGVKSTYVEEINSSVILLLPNEVTKLVNIFNNYIYEKVKIADKEGFRDELQSFFKGDFEGLTKTDFAKKARYFMFTIYMLSVKNRLDSDSFLKELECKKKLFFKKNSFEFNVKNFQEGKKPKHSWALVDFFEKLK